MVTLKVYQETWEKCCFQNLINQVQFSKFNRSSQFTLIDGIISNQKALETLVYLSLQ